MGLSFADDPLIQEVPKVRGFPLLSPCLLYARIGLGGMGAVYLARHLRLEIDVAVKCMLPHRAAHDETWILRFQREARLAARVNHQNLVRAYDVSCWQDLNYLVMDYVHGENARQRVLRRGALLAPEALAIVRHAAAGLAAAHRVSIVHRDIKPDNILISLDGQVKVADLGLAKALQPEEFEPTATIQTMTMGTPRYMSPEQWEDTRSVGPPTDVYALGATLFFLLAGRDALQGRSVSDLRHRATHEPFPSLRDAVPAAQQGLVELVRRATDRVPENRHADASEFLESLESLGDPRSLESLGGSVVASWTPPETRPSQHVLDEARELLTSRAHQAPPPAARSPERISIDCPDCGGTLRVPRAAAGRQGRCPRCGGIVQVPAAGARHRSPEPAPRGPPIATATAVVRPRHAHPQPKPTLSPSGNMRPAARWRRPIIGTTLVATTIACGWMFRSLWARDDDREKPRRLTSGPAIVSPVPYAVDPMSGSRFPEGWDVLDGTQGHDGWAMQVQEPTSGIVFQLIPPGEFLMGSPESEPERGADETQHPVRLSDAFYLGVTEVTVGQVERIEQTAVSGDDSSMPVNNISWKDARRLCRLIGCDLPTEAQWEYAARAGTTGRWWWGDSPDDGRGKANVSDFNAALARNHALQFSFDDNHAGLAQVARFEPNAFGLFDMIGNVWEWCVDDYIEDYNPNDRLNPRVEFDGGEHVLRGGSFTAPVHQTRLAFRLVTNGTPVNHEGSAQTGFRGALTLRRAD